MPNSCFDSSNFSISHQDAQGRTVRLSVDLHPGQMRIVDYLLSTTNYGIPDREALLRWCICWGLHALLGYPPLSVLLMEAKMDIFQDEMFEQQQDCLGVSVQKYLAAGNFDEARRVVGHSHDEYRQISCNYWRGRWLSTLTEPLNLLHQMGIRVATSR